MENERNESSDQLSDIHGAVKWFDPRKGFGFIVGPSGQDIFVHYTVIEGEGFRVLADGSPVVYSAENGDKGWRATKVVPDEVEGELEPAGDSNDGPDPEAEIVVPKRTYSRTPRR